ncbi:MAG TPA: haloacid dehalogenase type II [Candidatus Saccharimonadales bacterium]|jgi:2-haloacid dehalogenase|nr:haloacid dehalogenase type II [Candidatus Saccharimonadales bacterium]
MTVLAFDVNETLLDLRALDQPFAAAFGDAALRPQWFALMLQIAFVGGLTGRYVDFTTAQRSALSMLAARQRVTLSPAQSDAIVNGMRTLPPHPEVREAMGRLGKRFRLVALTNSPKDVAEAQMRNSGLRELLEHLYSADEVRRLKPAPEPYRMVAERSAVPIGDVRLVAAHGWDIAGALAAGCRAAFVARPGAALYPHGPQPDIVAPDLTGIADALERTTA